MITLRREWINGYPLPWYRPDTNEDYFFLSRQFPSLFRGGMSVSDTKVEGKCYYDDLLHALSEYDMGITTIEDPLVKFEGWEKALDEFLS